jgi:hypothetical protein
MYGRRVSPAPLGGMSGAGLRECVERRARQELRLDALGGAVVEFERVEL